MKIIYSFVLLLAFYLAFPGANQAQTPTDDLFMNQRESCIALIYENSSFDEYWEGSRLRANGAIATVKRNTVMPMIAIGLFDQLNLIVAAPFVQTASTEPNGGKFIGAEGFQDLNLALKGRVLSKQAGPGEVALLATAGFSTPMTNYLADYMPYSIGLGANEFNLRGILQYKLNNGIYARATLAYLFRGQAKAERDYYYNNGSYYSAWMDVPSAWNYQAVAGAWLLADVLKVEASYTGLKSTSGDDIRPYAAPQPTNKVSIGQAGILAQCYLKKPKGLGGLAYFSQTLHGRNMGKASIFGAGLTYQFRI